jgi:small conductance mechanosensitive channel
MDFDFLSAEKLIDPTTALGAMVLALVFMIAAWLLCTVTTRLVRRPSWVMGRLRQKVDKTVIVYFVRFKNIIIFLAAGIFYASLVPSLRALAGTLLAGAGITALIFGMAARSTLSNLVSGLSLAIYRPFRIGDKVSLDGEYGTVEDITLRHTIIRTWRFRRLIIPNEKIDGMMLINYSIIDPRLLCTIDMGVSYDTDIDLARRLVLDEANKCPHRLENAEEEPWFRVISHDDFAIGVRIYLWVPDADASWQARFWLLEHIKKRFDKEGVEIPFPYRTIVYKKDLPPPRHEEPGPEQAT